jgi:hypothetical protein
MKVRKAEATTTIISIILKIFLCSEAACPPYSPTHNEGEEGGSYNHHFMEVAKVIFFTYCFKIKDYNILQIGNVVQQSIPKYFSYKQALKALNHR